MHPEDLIAKRFRLAPAQATALRKLGLITIRDLLYHFPSRYEQQGSESNTRQLVPGKKVTLYGTLSKLKAKKLWKSRRAITEGWFEDATGRVKCMWFNQPYIASYISEGSFVRLAGTVGGSTGNPYIANPEFEVVPPGSTSAGLFKEVPTHGSGPRQNIGARNSVIPVYPESRGVTSLWFYHAIRKVCENGVHKTIKDPIPENIRKKYHLPDLATALMFIHSPEQQKHAEAARKRFAFEEIFVMQTARARERALNDSQTPFQIIKGASYVEKFLSSIAFPPTRAQSRAIADILKDFSGAHPMARLLEGDVGAGKTLVAAAAAYAVVHSRPPLKLASGEFGRLPNGDLAVRNSGTLQVAYMAPTEILATQHFQSFIEYFSHLPINIALITGSGCWKFPSKTRNYAEQTRNDAEKWRERVTNISRAQLLKWVENGEIAMVVGTHALIQKSVKFQNLAFAIVDEQHRFGVNQRKALIRRLPQKNAPQIDADGFLFKDLSYAIRNAAFTVHNELGRGHKEIVYQNALAEELGKRNIIFSREKQIDVLYGSKKVGIYQPDFVVDDKVVVEIKALPFTGTREKTQLWNYLKGSPYRLALLINFGTDSVDIVRVVFDTARSNLRQSASPMRSSAEMIPHFLSMTATPIPRTLALTIYGDLDISVLDELPPGRAKVTTRIIKKEGRDEAYENVRRELASGRQAFVVCPRIDQPQIDAENTQMNADTNPRKSARISYQRKSASLAKSAKAEAKHLQKVVFPEFRVGLLHGAMSAKEKDNTMRDFAAGKIHVLVATSVVEVGINVPNATVMMIEGAERFGLAQLHQLRGRIMRSSHPPHCFLLPETFGQVSSKRLRALEKSDDGFKLAEADLETRGAGDLLGKRQWGISDIGMEALKNPRLIQAAREEAFALVHEDSALGNYPELAARAESVSKALHSE
ncbi:MAG: GxxExxY protein [bacterium]|nr:GxxExxY protein [bacterium]